MAGAKRPTSDKSIPDLLRFQLSPHEVAYKAITSRLREMILSKALVAGTRLPTLTELAKLWNTNYFTVQTALTPLVNEGLLIRNQWRGTSVTHNTRQIKAVGIYFGSSFSQVRHSAFYQTLYSGLCEHFEKFGIIVHLFMDSRPRDQQRQPLKPLLRAIKRSEIHAVVATMTTSEEVDWLQQLPVPLGMLGGSTGPRHCEVLLGMENFLSSSLARLKERKCRSVALIASGALAGSQSFDELAAHAGLKTRPEWFLRSDAWPEEFEEFGIEAVAKIWSGASKPDGLIVYPDNIALGVIMGLLQHGVRVPEDLKLVMHCNEEIYFPCPLPADWQIVSVAKIVEALWKIIRAQAAGKLPGSTPIPLSLQPSTPDMPPMLRKWKSVVPSPAPSRSS